MASPVERQAMATHVKLIANTVDAVHREWLGNDVALTANESKVLLKAAIRLIEMAAVMVGD